MTRWTVQQHRSQAALFASSREAGLAADDWCSGANGGQRCGVEIYHLTEMRDGALIWRGLVAEIVDAEGFTIGFLARAPLDMMREDRMDRERDV